MTNLVSVFDVTDMIKFDEIRYGTRLHFDEPKRLGYTLLLPVEVGRRIEEIPTNE